MNKENKKEFEKKGSKQDRKDGKRQWDRKGKGQDKDFDKKKDYKGRERDNDKSPKNDPSWYFKYPELAENAARIPFNHRNGARLALHAGNNLNHTNFDPIATYLYIPTPGMSEDSNSPINLASKSAWKMLNRRFRGVAKYQQSDFGIIQFCVLDFMASISEAERIYGLLQYYSLNNLEVPISLLLAMGVDPFSFDDLADFRLKLNKIITAAQTLCLVKGYSYLDHLLLVSANVFKDKNTDRANLFAFVKAGYWAYTPQNPNGSACLFVRYSTDTKFAKAGGITVAHLRTAKSIIADLTDQMNRLLDDDDVDNVCSDILAFYGNKEDPAELVRLGLIPEDYCVRAQFSDDINRQIHNMTLVGSKSIADEWLQNYASIGGTTLSHLTTDQPQSFSFTTAPLIVYQEDNAIKFNMHFYAGTAHAAASSSSHYIMYGTAASAKFQFPRPIIDTDINSPTPKDVVEMTRFTNNTVHEAITESGTYYYRLNVETLSTLVIVGMLITQAVRPTYQYSNTGGTGFSNTLTLVNGDFAITPCDQVVDYLDYSTTAYKFIHFDWAPILYLFRTGPQTCYPVGDLDNYITLESFVLSEVHTIALLSEFKNPISEMILQEK